MFMIEREEQNVLGLKVSFVVYRRCTFKRSTEFQLKGVCKPELRGSGAHLVIRLAQDDFRAKAIRVSSLMVSSGNCGRTLRKTWAQSAFMASCSANQKILLKYTKFKRGWLLAVDEQMIIISEYLLIPSFELEMQPLNTRCMLS